MVNGEMVQLYNEKSSKHRSSTDIGHTVKFNRRDTVDKDLNDCVEKSAEENQFKITEMPTESIV